MREKSWQVPMSIAGVKVADTCQKKKKKEEEC
jgi:hypothetical protein